jgi:adenylate cyclase
VRAVGGRSHEPDLEPARRRGVEVVGRLRRSAASLLADALRRDPVRLDRAVELGIVRREWLDRPADEPISTATPIEVLERWLERTVEQKPSTVAALGLSTVQVLASNSEERARDGVPDTLTVVFTDLEGFSAYTANVGDEQSCHLLNEHRRVVGPIVRSRGGRLVKQLGDGLLLTFPSPEAALFAGFELLDAAPEPLRLRVGMHAGDVLVLPDRDVVGHVVNIAARVTEAARGGELLTTEAVRDAVRPLDGVVFGRLRTHALRNVAEPVRVCSARRATD